MQSGGCLQSGWFAVHSLSYLRRIGQTQLRETLVFRAGFAQPNCEGRGGKGDSKMIGFATNEKSIRRRNDWADAAVDRYKHAPMEEEILTDPPHSYNYFSHEINNLRDFPNPPTSTHPLHFYQEDKTAAQRASQTKSAGG